jgi:hypothetical protein
MKRPSYRAAVEWIALNDGPGNGDGADEVAGYISTCLVADLFDVASSRVARDIMRCRERELPPPVRKEWGGSWDKAERELYAKLGNGKGAK